MRAIDRGAKLLDKMYPEWHLNINGRIRPADPKLCTLGQVFGNYTDGLVALGLLIEDGPLIDDPILYGFLPEEDAGLARLSHMEICWNNAVLERDLVLG